MELGLSLGEAPARPPPYAVEKPAGMGQGLGFCMVLGVGLGGQEQRGLQLDLRPPGPVSRHPSSQMEFSWTRDAVYLEESTERRFDVNQVPLAEGEEAEASPNSNEMGGEEEAAERASPRASDEEENGLARKKLRLSKEQSAFLEESFKEHTTLNPKQKLALAKQLNLRPRQVEVWFQNRRARTKLKQTEVDCEYLKKCCETLTEENRRLQRELADLRALKTAHPLCAQLPATTLSICPSCERASASALSDHSNKPSSFAALFGKPRLFPFARHPAPHHQPSAAS